MVFIKTDINLHNFFADAIKTRKEFNDRLILELQIMSWKLEIQHRSWAMETQLLGFESNIKWYQIVNDVTAEINTLFEKFSLTYSLYPDIIESFHEDLLWIAKLAEILAAPEAAVESAINAAKADDVLRTYP